MQIRHAQKGDEAVSSATRQSMPLGGGATSMAAPAAGTANSGAQRFYDRLGIRREGKVCYVMDGWA